ncbi:MAG: hydrogenase [Desulfobulbaceae bacterium]|jgi:hydrogenase-4 component B|nr:hydrogenase [Desulfobulbaceae bacterium]
MRLLLNALALFIVSGGLALLSYHVPRLMRSLYATANLAAMLVALTALVDLHSRPETPSSFSLSWLGSFQLNFAIDPLSLFFLALILMVSPLIALYGGQYLGHGQEHRRNAVNLFLFNLLVVSMALVTMASDVVSFALAWECMSLSSFLLILHEYDKDETRSAAGLYFLFTQAGALCIFAAFGIVYAACGSLDFAAFAGAAPAMKTAAFLVALVGFGSKAGVAPLHIWLPRAHPAAPSHVSALMSGLMIKMGVYGILRLFFSLAYTAPFCGQVVLALGIVSGIFGVVMALGKHELKRLLAYSSIENIGVILIGLGLGMIGLAAGDKTMAAFAFAGGLLHTLNHALFKSLLFMGAGAVIQQTGLRHIDRMGGLMKTMPITGRSVVVGSTAIAGLPPFNGFISEFLIYYAAFLGARLTGIDALFAVAAILALAFIGGLAAACFTKVAAIVFLGQARKPLQPPAGEVGWSMRLVMIAFALACLVIGLWPEPFIGLAFTAISGLLPGPDAAAQTMIARLGWATRIFFTLFLVTALARRFAYRKKIVAHGPTWACGFNQPTARIQYTGASFVRSLTTFFHPIIQERRDYSGLGDKNMFPVWTARYASRIDDPAETSLRHVLAPAVFKGAAWLRFIQQGRIQLYIAYIVAAIVALLFAL